MPIYESTSKIGAITAKEPIDSVFAGTQQVFSSFVPTGTAVLTGVSCGVGFSLSVNTPPEKGVGTIQGTIRNTDKLALPFPASRIKNGLKLYLSNGADVMNKDSLYYVKSLSDGFTPMVINHANPKQLSLADLKKGAIYLTVSDSSGQYTPGNLKVQLIENQLVFSTSVTASAFGKAGGTLFAKNSGSDYYALIDKIETY